MSDAPRPMGLAAYAWRRLAQRWGTSLPHRVDPFATLYPPDRDRREGVFAASGPYSGVLRRESGRPFRVEPTEFAGEAKSRLAGEDRHYLSAEPDRILMAAADAGVYGNHGRVYSPPARSFVAETVERWDGPFARDDVFARPGFPAARPLPGVSLLLTSLGGQTFYHFLIETLPKLALARDLLGACDHVLISRYGEEWKRRWLEAWGVSDRILILDELSHYRCEQLLFTNRLVRHFEANPWAVAALRTMPGIPPAPAVPPPDGEIIWFDRGSAHLRRMDWEERVPGLIGARRVAFDSLPPAAAAEACHRARAIVGLHGAAFSNMIFCPPGVRILEIFAQPYYPWYARLAQACGHRHRALVVQGESDPPARIAEQVRRML